MTDKIGFPVSGKNAEVTIKSEVIAEQILFFKGLVKEHKVNISRILKTTKGTQLLEERVRKSLVLTGVRVSIKTNEQLDGYNFDQVLNDITKSLLKVLKNKRRKN